MQRLKHADIPQELVFGWPRSVLLGDEKLMIEQHEGVFACTETEIIVKTVCGHLRIDGQGLSIAQYSRDSLIVLGKIASLTYLSH